MKWWDMTHDDTPFHGGTPLYPTCWSKLEAISAAAAATSSAVGSGMAMPGPPSEPSPAGAKQLAIHEVLGWFMLVQGTNHRCHRCRGSFLHLNCLLRYLLGVMNDKTICWKDGRCHSFEVPEAGVLLGFGLNESDYITRSKIAGQIWATYV